MRSLDWAVVVAYVSWIVYDGLRRSKGTDKVEGYFLGNRSLPWWAIGLSVMATQMSAVTLVGTTGQAYLTGLRFIQFYFGLPLAMVILSVTLVPFFHRAKVYTAYEYLERRFDVRTRSLASFLFLMGRAFSLGVTLTAPAVVMSAILGWQMPVTVLVICVPMIVYTTYGGVQAVAWTDVKQMFIIVAGMSAAIVVLLLGIPRDVSFGQALHLAGATGRLKAVDFTFDLRQTYTFWSGMIGGLFLMLAYFGCDQSQVQRYLTAKSEDEARSSLLMSAYVKIPLQLLDPVHRRPRLRVLPVPAAADAVQPRLRRARRGRPVRVGVRVARAAVHRGDRRAPSSCGAVRPRRRFSRPTHAWSAYAAAPRTSSSRRPATCGTRTSTTCFRPSSRRACPSAWWG